MLFDERLFNEFDLGRQKNDFLSDADRALAADFF
jgi:hypothetical protein